MKKCFDGISCLSSKSPIAPGWRVCVRVRLCVCVCVCEKLGADGASHMSE